MENLFNNHLKSGSKILAFDLIRAVATFFVLAFHFNGRTGSDPAWDKFTFWGSTANSNYGSIAVSMFFILSGCLLYYQYSHINKDNIKKYYYKRWKCLFPMFYIVFLFYFITSAIRHKKLFYLGFPKFILSILGMDGYAFIYGYKVTYYNVGEWFLGAIIILYLIYPLVLKLFNKNVFLTMALGLGLYIFVESKIVFTLLYPNIMVCMFKLLLGMFMMKYFTYIYKNDVALILSGFAILFLYIHNYRLPYDLGTILTSVSIFIFLLNIADFISRFALLQKVISITSKYSFGIFLFQHKMIYYILDRYKEIPLNVNTEWTLLFIIMALTYIAAWIVYLINKELWNSKLLKKLDNFMLNK